jgi:hypothetical protein
VVPVTSADKQAEKQIVVGYDGSPDSEQALDWAVGGARLH